MRDDDRVWRAAGEERRIICILICILKHASLPPRSRRIRADSGPPRPPPSLPAKYDTPRAPARRISVVKASYTRPQEQPGGPEAIRACRS